ncbi:MAG: hypothetical protein O2930_09690 [Acidobacteria bacterium]|nr:hypothetical protein [Acidobacteriota bacterium]
MADAQVKARQRLVASVSAMAGAGVAANARVMAVAHLAGNAPRQADRANADAHV